jgi:hypothetical protein
MTFEDGSNLHDEVDRGRVRAPDSFIAADNNGWVSGPKLMKKLILMVFCAILWIEARRTDGGLSKDGQLGFQRQLPPGLADPRTQPEEKPSVLPLALSLL